MSRLDDLELCVNLGLSPWVSIGMVFESCENVSMHSFEAASVSEAHQAFEIAS
jgi:hypothetical protein